LEFYNPTGSVKDRAACYILKKLLDLQEIDQDTTMIESSSGNFGVALSAYCKMNRLKFICVVDPCISPINEMLIRSMGTLVIKVTEPDENGGYLLNRIRKVNSLLQDIDNSYWVNQYANPYNAEAYTETLAEEICNSMERLDYIFLGISSGGTITGVSRKIKERFPEAKVIGVDIVGSVIFGHPPKKRFIPGIGSSMVPDILKLARIDDVVMMDEVTTIRMCRELLEKHNIFAGGSSGSAYGAVKKYFTEKSPNPDRDINVVTIFPDRGDRYSNTVYDEDWCNDFIKNHVSLKEL
jgi:cysteine synthase A